MLTTQSVGARRSRSRLRAPGRHAAQPIERLESRRLLSGAVHTPVLEAPAASGDEDTAIPLQIGVRLNTADGAVLNSVTISNVPAGALLSAGADQGNGSWLLQPADLSGLTITPPPESDADFDLHVSATVTRNAGAPEVVLTSVAPDDPDRRVVYRLTNPSVRSFHTGAAGGAGTVEQFDLSFGTISVDYTPVDAAGNPLSARRASWDTETNRATGTDRYDPEAAAAAAHTLTLGNGRPLRVLDFDWLVTSPGSLGAASPGDFVFTTPLSAASPSLLVAGAAADAIQTAVLRSQVPLPGGGHRTTTWTLDNVTVTSHSVSLNDPAGFPVDTFALRVNSVRVETAGADAAGQPLPTAAAAWDFGRDISRLRPTRDGDLASRGGPITIELDGGVGFHPQFNVLSYSWGIDSAGTGASRSRDFSFTALPTGSDPMLVHSAAEGRHIDRAIVRASDAAGNVYATWTLSDVFISSFGTAGSDTAGPGAPPAVQRVSLDFNHVDFRYDPPPPDTRATARGIWDLGRNTTIGAGAFGDESYVGDKWIQLGTERVQVLAHDWSETKPLSGTVQMQDFLFTLPMNTASPGIMASVAAGHRIPEVRYTFQHPVAGTDTTQEVLYTFGNVILRSFGVAQSPEGGEARVRMGLDFQSIEVESRTRDRSGATIGTPSRATWDIRTGGSLAAAGAAAEPLAPMKPPAIEPLGAAANPAFAPHRLQLGPMQFEVLSYDWGAQRPFVAGGGTGSGPSTKRDMTVLLGWTPDLTRLFHATALGTHYQEAVLRSTTDAEDPAATYATWTLQDVTLSSAATSFSGVGDPVYAFTLRFEGAELRYDPAGVRLPVTAGYHWGTARGSGTTALGSEAATGPRTLTIGASTLPVGSYGWQLADGATLPVVGTFFFESPMSTASPGLMRAVGDARQFPTAVFRSVEPEAGGLRENTWTLDDVTVTSYDSSLADAAAAPVDGFSLGFRNIRVSTRWIDPAGHPVGTRMEVGADFALRPPRVQPRAPHFGNDSAGSRHAVDFGSGMADVLGFRIASAGRAFEPVHVTVPASSASPALFGQVLEGRFPWPAQLVIDEVLPVTVHSVADVAGRYTFYNRSGYDGGASAAGAADDAAVAIDKQPLLPGDAAGFDNLTSFPGGITGVMIDVAGLPTGDPLSPDDFVFRVGTVGDPSSWRPAPPPLEVARRDNAGASGSTRLSVTWSHGAIRNTWLQVTLKANARTGLANDDVFYFGNLPGETGDPRTPNRVSVFDYARILRARPARPADVTDPLDIDRDGVVGARDFLAVRRALFSSLPLITPQPAAPLAAAGSARPTDLLEESH